MTVIKSAVIEGLVLVVVSVGVAMASNAVRDGGLKLSKNYFRRLDLVNAPATVATPAKPSVTPKPPEKTTAPEQEPRESSSASAEPVTAEGLRVLSLAEVYDYSQYVTEEGSSIVFVDARNDEAYRHGHIPGALQLDPWNEDAYLPAILPTLQAATMIVCYCGGGECEDSIHLATRLVFDHGLPLENVYLFKGGWAEWTGADYPVRSGDEP